MSHCAFAIFVAFLGGQVTVFAIYLGPRWMVAVTPLATATAAVLLEYL